MSTGLGDGKGFEYGINLPALPTKDTSGFEYGINFPAIYAGDIVATPTDSPGSGSYADSVAVTLSCATSGASVYYTTDSSTPDATKTLYSSPFTLTVTTTVKAIGIKSGYTDSGILNSGYTIVPSQQLQQVILL